MRRQDKYYDQNVAEMAQHNNKPCMDMGDVSDLRVLMTSGLRSNYPVGMSDCFVCGINGDCGEDCPVLGSEECEHVEAMKAKEGAM